MVLPEFEENGVNKKHFNSALITRFYTIVSEMLKIRAWKSIFFLKIDSI